MVATLSNFTTIEQQAVTLFFLWSEAIKTTEICKRMLLKYGKHCAEQKNVYE
jgi:hypothetical protein